MRGTLRRALAFVLLVTLVVMLGPVSLAPAQEDVTRREGLPSEQAWTGRFAVEPQSEGGAGALDEPVAGTSGGTDVDDANGTSDLADPSDPNNAETPASSPDADGQYDDPSPDGSANDSGANSPDASGANGPRQDATTSVLDDSVAEVAAAVDVEEAAKPTDDAADETSDSEKARAEKATAEDLAAEANNSTPHVAYRTHVQTYGWQGYVRDGAVSGTSGQSKRLEAIVIKLEGAPVSGSIQYRTHVQTYGWQGWKADGAMSGTSGESKRLEAIQIQLTGAMSDRYDVWYRVHAQTFGWLGWTCDGQRAGTAGLSKRLEAIQIRILPKGSAAPGSTTRPFVTRMVQYRTHVQTYGWQGWASDGAVSGTSGQSKRLEGINIALVDQPYAGGIEYRTHVQTYGWQGYVRDGAMSGTSGQSKRLEAIQIRLYGQMADHFDVWYRVHAQTYGWMGWAKNDQQAGTAGLSKRLEAIQIVLLPKGSSAPASNYQGVQGMSSQPFVAGAGGTPLLGSRSSGPLRVRGSALVNKDGQAIQLRGVSTHGLAWFPQYVNDACFKQLRTEWNANVVRLAMYTEEYGGYCSGGNKSELTALVKKGVQLATNNDLYVIVDWHILSDGNPNAHVGEAKAFFNDISSTFGKNTNVLYEICNEPNGGTTWDDVRTYAMQVIPVIRKNDPDAIVIVGTPTWSQEVDKAAQNPLPYDNVMYALHFYASTHKDDLRNRMANAVRGGLPVFVTEFGICDASGNGAIDEASANSWVTTMKSLGVSWCMWSLCNKAESASVLKSSCAAASGFRTGDLATSGTWLLKALNGSLPAGQDASTGTGAGQGTTGGASTAASVTFASGSFACTATPSSSWSAGGGKTTYQYELSIRNTGPSCSSWSVTVPFNKAVSLTNGWNGTFAVNGSRLTIRNASYNGSVDKGATITGIGFQVTADAGLNVKP